MDNIETSWMSFLVGDDSDTTQITTHGDHNQISNIESHVIGDLSGFQIDLDGIVDLDEWVRISDGSSVMKRNVRDALVSNCGFLDLAEFVLGFFTRNWLQGESSLGVIEQSEAFVGLFDGYNIHETSWKSGISSDFTIDLDESLGDNGDDFLSCEGVLESVSQQND